MPPPRPPRKCDRAACTRRKRATAPEYIPAHAFPFNRHSHFPPLAAAVSLLIFLVARAVKYSST